MNAKNLAMKFALIAVLAVASVVLVLVQGLKLGRDLRGGHTLVFEFVPTEKDKEEGRDIAGEAVSILKERLDPQGLGDIGVRPNGKLRIEIEMPAASPETQRAKEAYLEALAELEEKNISRSEIRRIKLGDAEQRAAEIKRLAAGNESLAESLEALAAAYDERVKAQNELDELQSRLNTLRAGGGSESSIKDLQEQIKKATANLRIKQEADDDAELAITKTANIDTVLLRDILKSYVSRREKDSLEESKEGKAEIKSREKAFAAGVEKLRSSHESRAGEIDRVVSLYKKWDDNRQKYEDPSDIQRVVLRTGVLEFRVAPYAPRADNRFSISKDQMDKLIADLQSEGAEALRRKGGDYLWFPIRKGCDVSDSLVTADRAGKQYVLLCNTPGDVILHTTGEEAWELTSAYRTSDQNGREAVGFEMDPRGADLMGRLTEKHQTHCMAILLDDEVYTAPVIEKNAVIRDRGIITGPPSDEIEDLIRTLRAGSLPGKLNRNPVSINSFGPALGEEYKNMGFAAAKWGLIAVAAFMLIYYLLGGFVADAALVLNVIFVLGAMSLMKTALTLPGIAGIILTIGIAVDANVLIFERLREEQARGQSVRMAFKNAYERAFSAIFDSNATTLVVCLILGWVGTVEVRGFAITLGLGVIFSMFTALVVTRWIFQVLLDTNIIRKPMAMLHIIGTPKVNWMSKRYLFWAISAFMMVAGILSVISQGKDIWGIEFSAGSRVTITLKDGELIDGKLPTDAIFREKYLGAAEKMEGTAKLVATARVTREKDPELVKKFLRKYDTNGDGKLTRDEWLDQVKDEGGAENAEAVKSVKKRLSDYFDLLAKAAGANELTRQNLEGVLPDVSYQITTTETSVKLITDVAGKAFGTAMAERTSCDSELEKGVRDAVLGVDIAADGITQLTSDKIDGMNSDLRKDFRDFEGGILIVRKNISPAISRADMLSRIEDMRSQPDFEGKVYFTADAFGLKPAGENTYSEFAIVFMPSESSNTEDLAEDDFGEKVSELAAAALKRSDTVESRNFDPTIAGETAGRAIMAIVLSWIAIILYLWLRFGNWRWGLAAVICLIHDVVIVIGLVAMSAWLSTTLVGQALAIDSFKIDLPMVAAMLTVIGYSVNDTIVVFDRIRENRGKLTTVSSQVINASVNQTLSRTLLTSGTTLIVVVIMYMFGGPGIHPFSYALLAGIIFGTYSSVAIASPMLMGFRKALVARTTGSAAVTE